MPEDERVEEKGEEEKDILITCPSIQLSDTSLAHPPCETIVSAGILCFSVEPRTQNIYVLLGREVACTDEIEPGLWCDFGGRVKPGESAIGAAAREFAEESLGVVNVGLEEPLAPCSLAQGLKQALLAGQYFREVQVLLPSGGPIRRVRLYYLKEVPWQPDAGFAFACLRQQLLYTPYVAHPAFDLVTGQLNPDYLEKDVIAWWSVDRLAEVVRNKGKYRQQRFRRSFLHVLRYLVQELGQTTASTWCCW